MRLLGVVVLSVFSVQLTACDDGGGGGDTCQPSVCSRDCVAGGFQSGHCDGDRCVCDSAPPACEAGSCNSGCVSAGNESGFCSGDTCTCVPRGGTCDNGTCNSGCVSAGNESGHCQGDSCICVPTTPTCSNSTCNAQCIASGNDSGSCVGDTCTCVPPTGPECTTSDQCDDVSICISEHCVLAYGRDYRITMYGATGIPEVNWSGSAWDVPGGLPDPFLNFVVVGGSAYRTSTANDTLSPVWNEYFDLRINESTRIRWELWDEDLTSNDWILGAPNDADAWQVSIAFLKSGVAVDAAEGIEVTLFAEPL